MNIAIYIAIIAIIIAIIALSIVIIQISSDSGPGGSNTQQVMDLLTDPNFGLEEIKNEVRTIESEVQDPNHGIRVIKNYTASSTGGFYSIEIQCDRTFEVKSVLVKVDDPDNDIDVIWNRAYIFKDFPPVPGPNFLVGHQDYDPVSFSNTNPVELMSQMQIGTITVLGTSMSERNSFGIGGTIQSTFDSSNDVTNAEVLVETDADATCDLRVSGRF